MIKRILFTVLLAAAAATGMQAAEGAKPVVSILGDSYSTFDGYIPEGNEPWYFAREREELTDVRDVRQTWWWQLVAEGGYILGVNDSYSGATISYTGYNGDDYRARSFNTRLARIAPPDVLLIFGATNDSWCGAPLGEYVYDNLTLGHMYEFRPALGRLLSEAQARMPGTRIVYIINSELKPEITESICTECRHFGVEYVLLHDIDKRAGHPTVKGMEQIKDQVLKVLGGK